MFCLSLLKGWEGVHKLLGAGRSGIALNVVWTQGKGSIQSLSACLSFLCSEFSFAPQDIERTFLKDHNRCALQRVLRVLALEFNNYAQAMCYVTAYLMLTHTDATAAAMVRVINNNEKYIPGYWRTEAAAFGTDAFVFKALLEDHDSELAEHLVSCCISPETYLQKWFTALCIQVCGCGQGAIWATSLCGLVLPHGLNLLCWILPSLSLSAGH